MKVFILECRDDDGGIAIGAYSTKLRALVALRRAVGKERFASFRVRSKPSNQDWNEFHTPEPDEYGTYYALHSRRLDSHV